MRITPMEIQQKSFQRALRGYSAQEVENFLELVSSVYAEAVAEINRLREEVSRRDAELSQHREREVTLREMIVMAQRVAEDLRKGAAREAELITAEAGLKADEIVKGAHHRMADLQRQIQDLKKQRIQAEQELRGILETHFKLLDADREARARTDESEAKLAYMSPGPSAKK